MKLITNFIIIALITGSTCFLHSQTSLKKDNGYFLKRMNLLQQDTTIKETKTKNVSIGGIFLSVGTGLSVPLRGFANYSIVSFGVLSRLEYSSTSIFPFVIGAEIDYFNYPGSDNYKTINLLASLQTKIFSYGLTIEYVLSKLIQSAYTIPFLTFDIKNNSINREYDANAALDLIRKETKFSAGFGFGFTLFIFDFYAKYNYMKDLSNFGVYAKVKFPVVKF